MMKPDELAAILFWMKPKETDGRQVYVKSTGHPDGIPLFENDGTPAYDIDDLGLWVYQGPRTTVVPFREIVEVFAE